MELRKLKIISKIILFVGFMFFFSCEKGNEDRTYTKIDGIYTCEESSPHSGYKKYIVEIDKVNSQENVYIITNFHNQGNSEFLYANLNDDSLKIENQVISSLFINGNGLINDDFTRIEIIYTTDDGRIELDYFAAFSR